MLILDLFCGGGGTAERWSEVMGIAHKMTQAEIAESIPPAYTEWVGRQFQKVTHADEARVTTQETSNG